MNIPDKLKPYMKNLKIAFIVTCTTVITACQIRCTYKSIGNIIRSNVLDREKKSNPEYIYIDDPMYSIIVQSESDKLKNKSIRFDHIWKSLKHTLDSQLLWQCRNGDRAQRNKALKWLSTYHHSRDWDCLKLAQALDKDTAVLLARTQGSDLRYFLPPPIHVRRAALSQELISFKLRDMLFALQMVQRHSCIEHFLSRYFANVQEQAVESDDILESSKPHNISEKELCILCLQAMHHHLSLFYEDSYEDDEAAKILMKMGLMPIIAELFLRNDSDSDVALAVLPVLKVLSVHCNLLNEFFQNGLVRELSRLLRSQDVRLSSPSAVCLANLSGEYTYRPEIYLLHPLYRTSVPPVCDTLLVHGLRGGVFVTWRQRDRNCMKPVGYFDLTITDFDCEPCVDTSPRLDISDQQFKEVLEELIEIEDETLLSDLEVVLQDIPISVKREPKSFTYTAADKRTALMKENEDKCHYTFCWPKDWLPRDHDNIRILGLNYWSSLSDWLEPCPLQAADIASRASDLAPKLVAAKVGTGQRPVVWLAHSMGGLIIEQMLVGLSQSDDVTDNKMCENTKALIFYSTPHKGSAMATMPSAAAAVLWPSDDVRQLQENSPELLTLHEAFLRVLDRYKWDVVSFAETKPTPITAFHVPVHFVNPNSADLERGVFFEMSLNHLTICKPATRQSILYTTVIDVLNEVTGKNAVASKQSNTVIHSAVDSVWEFIAKKGQQIFEIIDGTQRTDKMKQLKKCFINVFSGSMD